MEEEKTQGKMTIKAVITRADGSEEDLGIISEGDIELKAGV